ELVPHLKVRQRVHATDELPELLNETTYQRQWSTLNLAIPTETGISLDLDQNQGRFCADFVRRPTRLRSRNRQGIGLYCCDLHARLLSSSLRCISVPYSSLGRGIPRKAP